MSMSKQKNPGISITISILTTVELIFMDTPTRCIDEYVSYGIATKILNQHNTTMNIK